jgi:protein-disulfide isomerase/plastocyanin
MEQKQLDEEDTFFGEEFIEEDTPKKELKEEKKPKKEKSKASTKKVAKKEVEDKMEIKEEPKTVIIDENDKEVKDKTEEVKITSTKEPIKEELKVETKAETIAPIDPWADEDEDEGGMFKSTSSWKFISGILIILLVVSIYTNGFGLAAGNGVGNDISLTEAEFKALDYVNNNLLQSPFVAELSNSEDAGNLYKVTLNVAGQTVDSYITKDGSLFFPQGFETVESVAEAVEVSMDDDAVKGDVNAPVTIIEFSDFECPFCGKYVAETYPQIVKDYIETGKVKYVFRDFPLDFHPSAQKAAEAAECAGEQGKYWEMHDVLFENQDALGVDTLKMYAVSLGLDTVEFDNCLDSGAMAEEVLADLADGQAYGVSGTPGFFINGKLLSGAQPFEAFKQEIEAALVEASGEVVVEEPVVEVTEEPVVVEEPVVEIMEEPETEVVVEEPVVVAPVGELKVVPVTAKKWMFGPNKIVAGVGDTVQLKIVPSGLEFTFALPAFGLEQEIVGPTTVEFTADTIGEFEFKCSSCEDWRGMTGTLVVE